VVPRFQTEWTFAWFQQKYRRLVGRWERIAACFEAFLTIATIHMWIQRLIVGEIQGGSDRRKPRCEPGSDDESYGQPHGRGQSRAGGNYEDANMPFS